MKFKWLIAMKLALLSSLALAQANEQKRVDFNYTAIFGKDTTVQWSSIHDMNDLEKVYDYHFKYQTVLVRDNNHFSFFASQDGISPWNSSNYTSRNFGFSWQSQGPKFGLSMSLSQQFHPWNGLDNGLHLKIDMNSRF